MKSPFSMHLTWHTLIFQGCLSSIIPNHQRLLMTELAMRRLSERSAEFWWFLVDFIPNKNGGFRWCFWLDFTYEAWGSWVFVWWILLAETVAFNDLESSHQSCIIFGILYSLKYAKDSPNLAIKNGDVWGFQCWLVRCRFYDLQVDNWWLLLRPGTDVAGVNKATVVNHLDTIGSHCFTKNCSNLICEKKTIMKQSPSNTIASSYPCTNLKDRAAERPLSSARASKNLVQTSWGHHP